MKTLYNKPINPEQFKGATFEAMHEVVDIAKKSASNFDSEKKEEVKKCLVCNSHNISNVLRAFGIDFVQCLNCTHVSQKFQISDESVYKFFEKDTEINCHLPDDQFQYRCEYINKPKIEETMKLRKEMGLSNRCGDWLDIGCGAGDLLFQLRKDYEWNCIGIDISEPGVEIAKENGINAYHTDLFKYFNNHYNTDHRTTYLFDVISAMGYFDLVRHPVKHLETVKKMMKKGGLLMVDHPKFDSFTGDLMKTLPECAGRYCNALERSIYTEKSMKYFLENNGFEIILDWKFGLDIYTFLSTIILKIPQLHQSPIIKYLLEKNDHFQNVIDSDGYSDTNYYVAKLL